MRRPLSTSGFTLIEVMVALVMLSFVLLTIGVGTTRYLSILTRNRIRLQAAAVADAQIAAIRVSPAYDSLTIRFDSTRSGVPFSGYSRVTRVVRTGAGTAADRTAVRVTVTGPQLPVPVIRYTTIAAP